MPAVAAMVATPEIEGTSIVCVGSFNPLIFQPRWLAEQNLLRSEEAAAAERPDGSGLLLHPTVATYRAEWLVLQVTQDRFVVSTDDPRHYQALRDLVSGIFGVLEHTPVAVLGISWHAHFRSADEAAWHALGHGLAPKTVWRDLLENPGLRSLSITGKRVGGADMRIKVEPSMRIKSGVFVDVHEEHRGAHEHDVVALMGQLRQGFDDFLEYAKRCADRILDEAKPK